MPAFLLEHRPVCHGQRAEHCVQVHVHQVLEIGLVGGGKGIHGLVREGHGVQKGRHAALQQLQKGRGDRVLLAACQHRVLQNVKNAGIIGGKSAETDAECLVDILVFHQQHRSAADIVGQQGQGAVLLRAFLGAQDGIAGIVIHGGFSFVFCDFCLYCIIHCPKRQLLVCSL